jgi:adenine deaminase
MHTVKGIIIDPVQRREFKGEITVKNGKIEQIRETPEAPNRYIIPGLVDAHIHIESSMLIPSEFARLAVKHGTVATVSDPHEIANVCGKEGVEYMIENGNKVPLKFYFGAPSCVPATTFETAGAVLDIHDVEDLLDRDEIVYLAEMMNWPGVLFDDPDVLAKIKAAHDRGKPVDGHAPGLKGDRAKKYASAGITTDHECFTKEEAIDKLKAGMLIVIREGSAAKNYNALIDLFGEYPDKIMFCSDDKHPDDLIRGHINEIVSRTIALGYDLFDTLHACSVLPVKHYGLHVGLLQTGDPADFIIVDQPESM